VIVEIGNWPVRIVANDAAFLRLIEQRYRRFVTDSERPGAELRVDLAQPDGLAGARDAKDDDLRVVLERGRWVLTRSDFHAEWEPLAGRGWIRQGPNAFSFDSVLRILHTLVLADRGGFLVHAASAIRNGRAHLFVGPSGSGKTTLARLAPPDATLLTDEVSYVARHNGEYHLFGTPFRGELNCLGSNVHAPLAAVYLLKKGRRNVLDPVAAADASRALLRQILFFASESALVARVFVAACDCARSVPGRRLTFAPQPRVWELIE
jgi:hypothetical protein